LDKISSFKEEYSFLSNFYPSVVSEEYDGTVINYPTVEHAFQANKSLDKDIRKKISELDSPAKAKRYGNTVSLRSDWEFIKLDVMRKFIHLKFQNEELKEKLLKTDGLYLEEGNVWNDTFWGVCRGKGRNNLGKILMEERDKVR